MITQVRVALAAAVFAFAAAMPNQAEAVPVTIDIGTFSWEDFGLGIIFSIQNDTTINSPDTLHKPFENLVLTLTVQGASDPIDVRDEDPTFPTTVGPSESASTVGLSGLEVLTATLQFNYSPGGSFPTLNFTRTFNTEPDPSTGEIFGVEFLTYTYDDGRTAPIPEPASLILFGSGLSWAAIHRRRRQHQN